MARGCTACLSHVTLVTHARTVLIIAGTTAVGKTDLSIHLAKRLNGEVISADSVQVPFKHRVYASILCGVCVHGYVYKQYVCMCACVHGYVCMCTWVCVHGYMGMCTWVCVHVYMGMCTCVGMCTCAHGYVYMCTWVCVHVYMGMCTWVCVQVHITGHISGLQTHGHWLCQDHQRHPGHSSTPSAGRGEHLSELLCR